MKKNISESHFYHTALNQFVKGKGFFGRDVRVAAHTQNWPKHWKLREKISKQNSTLALYFLSFQTIISRFHKCFVERNTFGKEKSSQSQMLLSGM